MLRDKFDRRIDYLRLSVTDRCNLRCVYCLPEGFRQFSDSKDVLTDDEVVELVSGFASLGLRQVRITGGEPLIRPGLTRLIKRLSNIEDLEEVSLSTNAVLLESHARDLARAGIRRVNISLDTLKEDRFHEITRFGALPAVLRGIEAAFEYLSPVKINVVVMAGTNDDEIQDFVKLTVDRPIHVRFIELMPMGETGYFNKPRWLPLDKIMAQAGPLEPLVRDSWPVSRGPARYFQRPGARGTVGFISALSCGFCDSCNRVRLSAGGTMHPCLDSPVGFDLRTPLRNGAGRREITNLIREAVMAKPERHAMNTRSSGEGSPRFMCQVGG